MSLDAILSAINDGFAAVVYFPVFGIPLVVLWLALGGIVCTVWMGFVNVRGFRHAIDVVRGKFDRSEDSGEVSHRQALASALSGTVGLGNIAGVAIAVSLGGPGATFWMVLCGFFGMSLKFTECTLGQMYRKVDAQGRVSGGPMHYLEDGLAGLGRPALGRALAVTFAVLCIGAALGGGNTFQVNQSLNAVAETIPFLDRFRWIYGAAVAVGVALVVLGGIRRIARAADRIVPAMGVAYVAMVLTVLVRNAGLVDDALRSIVRGALAPSAAYGGFVGVLVVGMRRAVFSSEAGAGSASIAHSAAKTDEPVREGIVALLEPFIDTVVVCTLTALVIVITGAYDNPDPAFAAAVAAEEGARLTSLALAGEVRWFPYVLSLVVVLFAFSTIITWSYYGERCARWLFGPRATGPFRVVYVTCSFAGALVTAGHVKTFSDLMLLSMAFPNVLGLYFLSPQVKRALDAYRARTLTARSRVPRPRVP